MKFKLFLLYILLINSEIGFAQIPNSIFGKIEYKSTLRQSLYINGVSDRTNNMSVYFSDTVSSFFINTFYDLSKDAIAKKFNISDSNRLNELYNKIIPTLTARLGPIYYNHIIGSLVFTNKWLDPNNEAFCLIDSIKEYNWTLLPDTSRILGFFCQKAICKAAIMDNVERIYTAWYTPEIPIPFGPHKFFGLPGLILEVNEKYYNFKVKSIILSLDQNEKMILKCCSEKKNISKKIAKEMNVKYEDDFLNMSILNNN
jgi:GLPGLI family protein